MSSWVVVGTVLATWLTRTPDAQLRNQLRDWQFWALELQFLLVVALSCVEIPRLSRSLPLSRREYRFPAAVAVLACVLVFLVAPRTNRIYYDEHIYQSVGQNLTDLRKAQMCNDGNVEYGRLHCFRGEYSKEPYGYPYVLSLIYRIVGVREAAAFTWNGVTTACLVVVVFLLTTSLTGTARAGQYASIVAALVPEQLRWSHSAATEPTAALVCALAVLTAVHFVRTATTSALLWMVSATAFAAQFRPECLLVAVVVVAIVAIHKPAEFVRPRLWWAGLLGVVLVAVLLGHLVAIRHEGWGASGSRLSLEFLRANLQTNGGFFLGDGRFPVIYTALAIAGALLCRQRRTVISLLIYFAAFWGIFLFFYAGSYNYGADDRFSLMAYPSIASLAGIGLWRVVEYVRHDGLSGPMHRVAIAMLFVQFLWYVPFVRAIGEEAWGARADVAFAKTLARELPANSLVLTHNPSMFHLWGQSAAQISIATNEPDYLSRVAAPRYAGGVFFHWNFWCNVADPVQQAFCTGVLRRFPHTLIREYRERDYRYALYRLDVTGDR